MLKKRMLSLLLVLAVVFTVPMQSFAGSGKSVMTLSADDSSLPSIKAGNIAGRQTLNFNTDWLYTPNDLKNGHLVNLSDSSFEKVSVPHANKILETHKGNDFQKQIESFRFISWYRRHFALGSEYAGKRITVDFQGVATVADVYVNGEHVGRHEGAYTSFSLDITDFVYTDGSDNVIAVRVDSTKHSDLPPEGGDVDYLLFGGIVRDVSMTITDPVYVDWTFLTTPELKDESGSPVDVQVNIANGSTDSAACKVETIIKDANGNVVTSVSSNQTIAAGNSQVVEQTTSKVSNPNLWSIENPYLYTALTRIIVNGNEIDTYETRFGFRYFEFKNGTKAGEDASFYLNGVKTEIVGINRHEQWPWVGRAVPNKLQAADADMIKDTGLNAVRTSHYPQDPDFLARCDEIGLIVFEEAPGWQHLGDLEWQEHYKENLKEMVIRDRNHASIISWGTRVNESLDSTNLYKETHALVKELDPSRPTHGVRKRGSDANPRYKDFDEDIYTQNYDYPAVPTHTPYLVTEHTMDWGSRGMAEATDTLAAAWIGSWAANLEYYYGNDLVAGGFGWSMFDYNNEVNYTNTGYVFPSGLYDIFRLDKPVSYLYRSQKDPSEEKVLYIANYWTTGSPSSVLVLSNCDEVELFVNGVSKGRKSPNKYMNLPHPAFEFTGNTFSAGELRAVGYINGEMVTETTRKTPGSAAKLILEADYDTLAADGTDMTAVTVTAVDADGTRMPYAANTVTIDLEGEGKFIGEKSIDLEGGRVGFLVQSKYLEAGTITCEVTSPGLESDTCEITVEPYIAEDLVPVSDGSGGIGPIKLLDVNDNQVGSGYNQFQYVGNWLYTAASGCYMGDNHYSNTADDYCEIKFSGSNIQFYGAKASDHGILAASVDGGDEILIDCYQATRSDNVLLFDSGELTPGEHTLRIRVTGTKNTLATGNYVNVDRAQITDDGRKFLTARQSVYNYAGSISTTNVRNDFELGTGSGTDYGIEGNTPENWVGNALWIAQGACLYNHPFTKAEAEGKVLYIRFDYKLCNGQDGDQRISAIAGGEATIDADLATQTLSSSGFLRQTVRDVVVVLDNIRHAVYYYCDGNLFASKENIGDDKVLTGIALHGGISTNHVQEIYNANYGTVVSMDLSLEVWEQQVICNLVSTADNGTSGLLAIYDSRDRLTHVYKNPEEDLKLTLPNEAYTAKSFLWDSNVKPLTEPNTLPFTTTGSKIETGTEDASITMELDSETVGNGEVSLVCYDPNWDKTDLDTMHIAYLNQYTLENEKKTVTFALNSAPLPGEYTVVIGSSEGKTVETFELLKPGKLVIKCDGFTYNGTKKAAPSVVSNTNTGKEVKYRYYSDSECKNEITVTKDGIKNAGTYYVVGTVDATAAHSAAVSNKVSFTIAKATVTNAAVSGIKTKYYTGKALTQPKMTVAGYKAGVDYRVSYENNTKVGTATVIITFQGNYRGTVKKTFKIKNAIPVKNKVYKVGKYYYKVTKSAESKGTVELVKPTTKNLKSVKIRQTVKINGYTFLVTAIASKAFNNNKKLTNVTIGKNVTKIGSKAFNGCKKLNSIKITSKKLTSVGRNAFKGISSKANIKVPASKLTKYKVMLTKKGQSSTVTITR